MYSKDTLKIQELYTMVKMPFEKKQSLPPVDIGKLIDKGAPVKEEVREDDSKSKTNINLRIPLDMLDEIDAVVSETVGISRTGWILQTIQKELKRLRSLKKEDS